MDSQSVRERERERVVEEEEEEEGISIVCFTSVVSRILSVAESCDCERVSGGGRSNTYIYPLLSLPIPSLDYIQFFNKLKKFYCDLYKALISVPSSCINALR